VTPSCYTAYVLVVPTNSAVKPVWGRYPRGLAAYTD
jgi:hypothetical protein